MVTPEWSDWRNGFFWWIQSVYVEPAFRRQGVFRALHERIRVEALSRADVCGLRLYVHHHNGRAMETYHTLGMGKTDYLLFEEEFLKS
jgi:GNAT superfamily N-acetyltransferase